MTDDEVFRTLSDPLYSDIRSQDNFPAARPLLAHYTSWDAAEAILTNEQLWMSHPMAMNDTEELWWGIMSGAAAVRSSSEVREACGTDARYRRFQDCFDKQFHEFEHDHAFDIFAFCFSKHDQRRHKDGLLSMWRGYGGFGKGVAIVFDTNAVVPNEESTLMLNKVIYASGSDRQYWIKQKVDHFAQTLAKLNPSDEQLYLASYAILERVKLFALYSKHEGFREEREWRLVYLKQRDTKGLLSPMIGHHSAPSGVATKLKLDLKSVGRSMDLTLDRLIHSIILGPGLASPLSVKATQVMLTRINKPHLIERLHRSSTPFRS